MSAPVETDVGLADSPQVAAMVDAVVVGLPHTGEQALVERLAAHPSVMVDLDAIRFRARAVQVWRAHPQAVVALNVCSPVERFARLLADLRRDDPSLDLTRVLADPLLRTRHLWPGCYADLVARQLHPQQRARLHLHVADDEPVAVARSTSALLERLGADPSPPVAQGPSATPAPPPASSSLPAHEMLQLQRIYTIPNERFFELLGREIPAWSPDR